MNKLGDSLIVSGQVLSECFCCDLSACKGICCVEGDSGAPLTAEECTLLEQEWPTYAPYMQKNGIRSIEKLGAWVTDYEGDSVTPLIDGKECAYAFFENGICCCAIERAWSKGETSFRKPISCWLYPVRVQKLANNTIALNYHEWHLCQAACGKGEQLKLRVFEFLREPLIHCFGEETYKAIQEAADNPG